jgi:hypothetical protein
MSVLAGIAGFVSVTALVLLIALAVAICSVHRYANTPP